MSALTASSTPAAPERQPYRPGKIQRCKSCRQYWRHAEDAAYCLKCATVLAEQAQQRAQQEETYRVLTLCSYDFLCWVSQQRNAFIDRCQQEVIADFGEEAAASWAGEVEGGQQDASVFYETDARIYARVRREVGAHPTWERMQERFR